MKMPSRRRIPIYLTVFYRLVLQCSCNELEVPVPRIVGGSIAPNNLYPWFARSTRKEQVCGGTLIHPEFVLTAAHCIGDIRKWLAFGGFEIGAYCDRSNDANNCGQYSEFFNPLEIFVHPDFNNETFENDYALVKLDGKSTITPANIDINNLSNSYEDLNIKRGLWAVGFGLLEEGTEYLPYKLHHVEVNYVKNDNCDSSLRNYIFDDDKMMCAKADGKDACGGDSGGPLYDKNNDAVVGVTSWGIGCARQDYPGVYSRISSGLSWIQENACRDNRTNKDGTVMNLCPCNDTENRIRIETKQHVGKIVFRIKKKGQNLWQTKLFSTSGVREFCVPKKDCLSLNVMIKRGKGSYSVRSNGTLLIQDIIDGPAEKKIIFSCTREEHNSYHE
mmetsp:Transcript_19533/g.24618  ORF Transcript_19533/g.24618 Transcript_19533/m.24618 type:complete len:389 (+) Transcript_19533:61-1227(+)